MEKVVGPLYHEGSVERTVKRADPSLRFLLACVLVLLVAHWANPVLGIASSPAAEITSVAVPVQPIRWKTLSDPSEERALDSWRGGVGIPLIIIPSAAVHEIKSLDSLIVVSWNIHMGGGDLDRFIRDLKEGRLTDGSRVQDFVLLLQEVFRQGSDVPASVPPGVRTGGCIRCSPPSGERMDIREIARRHNLALYYVPAMRNGETDGSEAPEDRGSAIVSTLTMSSFTAMELPYERQRRLAIGANISGETSAGAPWTVQFINVHLENRARWSRFFRSFGRARLRQVTAVIDAFSGATPTVLGGDFNTWFRGSKESAVRHVDESFDSPHQHLQHGTVRYGPLLPERMVDYLFFRLPEGWSAHYQRIDTLYGSDHYPLLGRVQIGRDEALGQ
jgi:endonuclease/exonuclease/phosphatase family metal-dependent hydrolase